ncbi:hypothetical protein CFB41_37025, partial [Burkholderia sp. AU33803]
MGANLVQPICRLPYRMPYMTSNLPCSMMHTARSPTFAIESSPTPGRSSQASRTRPGKQIEL